MRNTIKSLDYQTYPKKNYEIIVIDDGSTDDTLITVKEMQKNVKNLFYYSQGHMGYALARNFGIQKTKGSIIAFIDDDCIAYNDWLERIANSYKNHKDAFAIGGKTESLLSDNIYGSFREYFADFEVKESIKLFSILRNNKLNKNCIVNLPTMNLSLKKEIFAKIGYFNPKYQFFPYEDNELTWRLFKNGYSILYDPLIKIKHFHAATLKGFIRKSFGDGITVSLAKNIWKDYPSNTFGNFKEIIYYIGGLFILPLLEVRVIKDIKKKIFLFPIFYLHEFFFRIGIFYGYLIS